MVARVTTILSVSSWRSFRTPSCLFRSLTNWAARSGLNLMIAGEKDSSELEMNRVMRSSVTLFPSASVPRYEVDRDVATVLTGPVPVSPSLRPWAAGHIHFQRPASARKGRPQLWQPSRTGETNCDAPRTFPAGCRE